MGTPSAIILLFSEGTVGGVGYAFPAGDPVISGVPSFLFHSVTGFRILNASQVLA